MRICCGGEKIGHKVGERRYVVEWERYDMGERCSIDYPRDLSECMMR